MHKIRKTLYFVARLLGDIQAVRSNKKGAISKRIQRRLLGKIFGKVIGRIVR